MGKKLIHLHGQRGCGNPANLVANREGLVAMQRAIEQVLRSDPIGNASAMLVSADGHPFRIYIKMRNDQAYWEKAAVPYSRLSDREKRPDALWPWKEHDGKPIEE